MLSVLYFRLCCFHSSTEVDVFESVKLAFLHKGFLHIAHSLLHRENICLSSGIVIFLMHSCLFVSLFTLCSNIFIILLSNVHYK